MDYHGTIAVSVCGHYGQKKANVIFPDRQRLHDMDDYSALDPNLLADYFMGDAPHATATVRQWVGADPDREEWLRQARVAWIAARTDNAPPLDVEAFYVRLARRTGVQGVERTSPTTTHADRRRAQSDQESRQTLQTRQVQGVERTPGQSATRPPRRFRSAGYAGASLVLAILLILAGWWNGVDRMRSQLSDSRSLYTTANGERATITLPDGSTVVLNVASQLEVPADYATGNRTVRLTGEGLFTVKHATASPFVVNAGPSRTRVLGTSFLVRHYPTDTAATVAVQEGKVVVQSTILTAQQQLQVSAHGMTPVQQAISTQFGFATGTMTLQGVRLRDAIADLNRWYDAEIRIADPLLDQRTIAMECGQESVADLAAILSMALDIRVERNGRILTLFPK